MLGTKGINHYSVEKELLKVHPHVNEEYVLP